MVFSGPLANRLCAMVLAALAVLLCSAPAAAQDAPALRWSPRWTRFTELQYTVSAGALLGSFASDAWLKSPEQPRWTERYTLDSATRGLLVAETEAGRRRASNISDVFAFGLIAYPFAIDTLLVAAGIDRSYDVAWQMAMIGVQSVLITRLATGLAKHLAGRARPDYGRCSEGNELACSSTSESFFSGHTSTAFAGAGLICAHHQNLRLYGSATAAAITCGTALGLATTVGTLRIVADRHHLTDVLTGAAVGLAAGYLLPNLMNYDFGHGASDPGSMALMPMLAPRSAGLAVAGAF